MTDMPRNIIGSEDESQDQLSDEELLARIAPSEPVALRWCYRNGSIQLYERRLRSLKEHGIGPALQAWIRSRMEWIRDNKLREKPDGLVCVSVDPDGTADVWQENATLAPALTLEDLLWDGDVLLGAAFAGSVWVYADGKVMHAPGQLKDACENFGRELMETLGYVVSAEAPTRAAAEAGEVFVISEEFGFIALAGAGSASDGTLTERIRGCFDKLFS